MHKQSLEPELMVRFFEKIIMGDVEFYSENAF